MKKQKQEVAVTQTNNLDNNDQNINPRLMSVEDSQHNSSFANTGQILATSHKYKEKKQHNNHRNTQVIDDLAQLNE